MPIHNQDIAGMFNRYADLLEIQGANVFRIRAYRNAARMIGDYGQEISVLIDRNEDLSELPGIGKDLAAKMHEIVQSGHLRALDTLQGEIPAELSELMRIPGLGPKKVALLYRELGVTDLHQLRKALEEEKIRKLSGFGVKSEMLIKKGLDRLAGAKRRYKLLQADEIVPDLLAYLKRTPGVKEVIAAGSYRRRSETVGDIDILVIHAKDSRVMDRFVQYEDVERVVAKGATRSSVLLRQGIQVDLRAVAQVSCGAALHYFTGSRAHNIAVRKIGVARGLKINEYGVFKGKKRIAGRTEEEVYHQVGLPYIEPELREDNGEIEAARDNALPRLVTLEDIRGDLHAHTRRTDGHDTLEDMAAAAARLGYEYLAITEHSKKVSVAGGLDEKDLALHLEAIEAANEQSGRIRLLKGVEVDILEDGSLDLANDMLRRLDLVVCSVHSAFNLSRQKQTERIIRAMDNPYFQILGHPTGRLINEREPYDVDMEQLMGAAAERGCCMELNGYPDRLDLNDVHLKMARGYGIKVAVSTDAHSVDNLRFMHYGVGQARRGWLSAEDVLNTRPWPELKKMLQRS